MSDTPISLSKFRKAKARRAAKQQADANAVKFGRPKPARAAEEQALSTQITHLDQHRREIPKRGKNDEDDGTPRED